jgi:hypothetical protein
MSLNIPTVRRFKSHFEVKGSTSGIFVNFGQFFPCSWILIRIPNTDPDPGGAKSTRVRIRNTDS